MEKQLVKHKLCWHKYLPWGLILVLHYNTLYSYLPKNIGISPSIKDALQNA